MQIGLVGLGKMGGGIARRLCRADIHVVGFDTGAGVAEALASEPGFVAAYSVDSLLLALKAPRIVWCMLPAGEATQRLMDDLLAKLAPGDCVVDGANGHYREAMARAARFEAAGIGFVDAGVSGGVWGLENGYSLMLGGGEADVAAIERVVRALAPHPGQWLRCGPAGAGHFVKMVHNGIEYGLMQAYAEGFALLKDHPDFDLDLGAIAGTWMQGSVVRSWLLELLRDVLGDGASLEGVAPIVADSGEGRWTARESIDRGVPTPVITAALMQRFASQGHDDFANRLLATLRNRFGGHAIPGKDG
jgi:6-phosphogluconate dehydrogenase